MAKAVKKQTLFIAIGPKTWGTSGYEIGLGKTKKDAAQNLQDNDGGDVTQFLEVNLPTLEAVLNKAPVIKVEIK